MIRSRRAVSPWSGAVCGLIALMACGCGDASTVNGKVTRNGKPVVWGTVILVDGRGVYHQGTIDANGQYQVENVPNGAVKIAVTSPKPPDQPTGRPAAAGNKGNTKSGAAPKVGATPRGAPTLEDPRGEFRDSHAPSVHPPAPPPGTWFAIPGKYSDPSQSGLTGTVKRDEPIDIELK